MSRAVGFVVVEFNQASGQPDLNMCGLYATVQEAGADAERARLEANDIGRAETYAVAVVELVEEPQ